jgi:hypothetical protein
MPKSKGWNTSGQKDEAERNVKPAEQNVLLSTVKNDRIAN